MAERGESVVDPAAIGESPAGESEAFGRLAGLLGRAISGDEARGWAHLSPSMRSRALERAELMSVWWGARGDLTAAAAAARAGVSVKRFYQMASAWRKEPGLLAVGAYAAARPDRSSRIHPLVNAALQASVAKVVAEGADRSVEWLRRRLEAVASAALLERDEAGLELRMPSPNVVRAVITREMNRVGESRLLGESVAMDCCPTSMRSADGLPWAVFAIIDRGTLRILGSAIGTLDRGVEGYSLAARSALVWMFANRVAALPWASATRRADIVLDDGDDGLGALVADYRATSAAVEFQPVTGAKRFGSLFRRYVGQRIGRVLLRPSWASDAPPAAEGDEVFSRADAAARVDREVRLHNDAHALDRPVGGADGPPDTLIDLLRFVAGGPEAVEGAA